MNKTIFEYVNSIGRLDANESSASIKDMYQKIGRKSEVELILALR